MSKVQELRLLLESEVYPKEVITYLHFEDYEYDSHEGLFKYRRRNITKNPHNIDTDELTKKIFDYTRHYYDIEAFEQDGQSYLNLTAPEVTYHIVVERRSLDSKGTYENPTGAIHALEQIVDKAGYKGMFSYDNWGYDDITATIDKRVSFKEAEEIAKKVSAALPPVSTHWIENYLSEKKDCKIFMISTPKDNFESQIGLWEY